MTKFFSRTLSNEVATYEKDRADKDIQKKWEVEQVHYCRPRESWFSFEFWHNGPKIELEIRDELSIKLKFF